MSQKNGLHVIFQLQVSIQSIGCLSRPLLSGINMTMNDNFSEMTRQKIQSREQNLHMEAMKKVGDTSQILPPLPSKYNKQYVVTLLKTILSQIEKHKFNRHELEFSLRSSIGALLAKIEVDGDIK